MQNLTKVLEDLDTARREPGGVALAAASGLMIAALVARFFLFLRGGFIMPQTDTWIALPVGLAFLFTAGSTAHALRAVTDAKAVRWAFVGNVVPPTVLCLPTILGLFYSVPAGLLAYGLIVPVVLAGRAIRRGDPRVVAARERLVAAGALVATTALLAIIHMPPIHRSWQPAPTLLEHLAQALPLAVTGAVGCALAARSLVSEAVRLRAGDALAAGAKGWRVQPSVDSVREVSRVADVGDGPMRTFVVTEPVGVLVASTRRAIVAAVLVGIGAVAMCAGALRILG